MSILKLLFALLEHLYGSEARAHFPSSDPTPSSYRKVKGKEADYILADLIMAKLETNVFRMGRKV